MNMEQPKKQEETDMQFVDSLIERIKSGKGDVGETTGLLIAKRIIENGEKSLKDKEASEKLTRFYRSYTA